MEDLGVGLRYYVWNHFFVRPEIHYYHIDGNNNISTGVSAPTTYSAWAPRSVTPSATIRILTPPRDRVFWLRRS